MVLVIEDEVLIALEIEQVLKEAGYGTLPVAQNYQQALRRIASDPFDACILDLDLGKGASGEVAREPEGRRVLSLLRSRGIPAIVYSGQLRSQPALDQLHPGVVTIDKSEPFERILEVLHGLLRAKSKDHQGTVSKR